MAYFYPKLFSSFFNDMTHNSIQKQKSNPTPKAGGGYDLSDSDIAKQFNALSSVLKCTC